MQVNLLPWRKQQQSKLLYQLLSACFFQLIFMGYILYYLAKQLDHDFYLVTNQIQQVQTAYSALEQKIADHELVAQQHHQLSNVIAALHQRQQHNNNTIKLFQSLPIWLSENLWLEKVSIHQQKITIIANSLSYPEISISSDNINHGLAVTQFKLMMVNAKMMTAPALIAYFNFKIEATWDSLNGLSH